jgi:1-deoxy-D-xylulose-5-phosphate reductoisomerase
MLCLVTRSYEKGLTMKRLAIIGSTGSIGRTTLDVVRNLKDKLSISTLAAHSNIDLLEQQAKEFQPSMIAVYDEAAALKLQKRLPNIPVVPGMEGLNVAASHDDVDFTVSAICGSLGLEPTLTAINKGKDVGLANKEALIAGGCLVNEALRKSGTSLLPIDSEHSAIFQCLQGENIPTMRRIILTASGGPFRKYSKEQLANITLADALRHPTWNMGTKITIDSSTLMNKGLEVIEAHWLFGAHADNIDVVIHPQSIIHSMVEFIDGSMIAQMSEPSMAVPIQYAITYPERYKGIHEPFDFTKQRSLEFDVPDLEKFPCLRLAYEALRCGKSMACYMNAANEVLVNKFASGEISWQAIGQKLEELMSRHSPKAINSLDDLYEIDRQAREDA